MRTLTKIQITLLVLVIMVAIPFTCYAVDGKIQIGQTASTTFPITISQSGSYILTSNLTVSTDVNCIVISADNVTLDLNGFALIGSGASSSSASGISSSDRKNITIKNGTIRDFSYNGIYFHASGVTYQNHQLKDIKVFNNENGIRATGTNISNCSATWNDERGFWVIFGSTLTDCVANDNGTQGIYALKSTITNCTANGNTDSGIDADDSTITNCTANNNTGYGIDADDSTITNCTANNNTGYGIAAFNSIITNCMAKSNLGDGIFSNGCTINNCTANNTTGHGIYASGSTITNCTARSNTDFGIYAIGTNTITNCTLNQNTGDGIYAEGSATITNCIANDNEVGFEVNRSTVTNCIANSNRIGISPTKSRIDGNNVRYNDDYGINADNGSQDNYIIKNTASGNGVLNFRHSGTNNYFPICGVDATDNCNYGF